MIIFQCVEKSLPHKEFFIGQPINRRNSNSDLWSEIISVNSKPLISKKSKLFPCLNVLDNDIAEIPRLHFSNATIVMPYMHILKLPKRSKGYKVLNRIIKGYLLINTHKKSIKTSFLKKVLRWIWQSSYLGFIIFSCENELDFRFSSMAKHWSSLYNNLIEIMVLNQVVYHPMRLLLYTYAYLTEYWESGAYIDYIFPIFKLSPNKSDQEDYYGNENNHENSNIVRIIKVNSDKIKVNWIWSRKKSSSKCCQMVWFTERFVIVSTVFHLKWRVAFYAVYIYFFFFLRWFLNHPIRLCFY